MESRKFRYETHSHTYEGSACGKTMGKDYIAFMMDKGYAGMIITDHFFNGNCRVPRELPWEQKVEQYCSGYEHARQAAEGTGFSVFFGVEFNFQGDEFLLYGIDKRWLLQHHEIMEMTRKELLDAVHAAGGIMIQAHPYRERGYLNTIHLSPEFCDGAETYNAANEPYQNALGYEYAGIHHLRMTAGSDIHFFHDNPMGAMEFSHPLKDIEDFVRSFLHGEGIPVSRRPEGVFVPVETLSEECRTERKPVLPVVYH